MSMDGQVKWKTGEDPLFNKGGAILVDDLLLAVGTLFIYCHEEIRELVGVDAARTDREAKGNFYLAFTKQLNDRMKLISTTYYQPVLDDWDDTTLVEDILFDLKLYKALSLALDFGIKYDTNAPLQVDDLDITYSTSFRFSF